MLLGRLVRLIGLAHLVTGAIVATVLLSEPNIRRYGDTLQMALPLLAWSCSATKGHGSEYALRFVLVMAIAHDTKAALGETPLNQRPSGGYRGFPSAHTAAAVSGASSLAYDCVRGNIAAQAVVLGAAALVGASRIAVGAHDLWQVLAGALLAWAVDRALRRGPGRAALVRWIGRARAGLRIEGPGQASASRLAFGAMLVSVGLVFGLAHSAR